MGNYTEVYSRSCLIYLLDVMTNIFSEPNKFKGEITQKYIEDLDSFNNILEINHKTGNGTKLSKHEAIWRSRN